MLGRKGFNMSFEYSLERLGSNIRKYRLDRGVTQEWLLEQLELHNRKSIWKYESGIVNITAKKLFILCTALKVTPNQLFEVNEDESIVIAVTDREEKEFLLRIIEFAKTERERAKNKK